MNLDTPSNRFTGDHEGKIRTIYIKYLSLQWDGEKIETQKGGLEGNELLKVNCTIIADTADTEEIQMQGKNPITMAGEMVLGDAVKKVCQFTLLANGVKKQQIELNLAPFEGKRFESHTIDFFECGVTMTILVTVLPV